MHVKEKCEVAERNSSASASASRNPRQDEQFKVDEFKFYLNDLIYKGNNGPVW